MVKWVFDENILNFNNFFFRHLVLRLTTSKLYFNFSHFWTLLFLSIFLHSPPSFDLEPSPSMYYDYISGVQCFSPTLGINSPLCSCFSSLSFSVKLSGNCYRSGILVPCCGVVSYGVVCYFGQCWSSFSLGFG